MSKLILVLATVFMTLTSIAQSGKFSLQGNYGLNGKFFVRSFDENGGPGPKKYLYKKNFLGSIYGLSASYKIGKSSLIVAGFERSTYVGRKNFFETINGVDISIKDFRLQHLNRIVSLGYGHQLMSKKSGLTLDAGLMLMYGVQQSIEVYYWDTILLEETNYKNANAVEGGVFFGAAWGMKIDTKFDFGLKARIYYLISTNDLELVSLSPTLTYHFFKVKKPGTKNQ